MMRPIRGAVDLYGEKLQTHTRIEKYFEQLAFLYGFQEFRTPIIEYANVFKRSVGETTDIISKEMFSFKDRNDEDICLRPEGTAPIMRAVLSEKLLQSNSLPLKYFYIGPMFRYERPQKGRQRQFHQLGVEYINEDSVVSDLECLLLAHNFLKACKIKDINLEVNTLGDQKARQSYKLSLVEYLQKYEKDLSSESQKRLLHNPLRILDSKSAHDQAILEGGPSLKDFLHKDSKQRFEDLLNMLEHLAIPYAINPKLVRGLDYYCETTFEFKSSQLGAQSTLLGGGRYDHLSSMLGHTRVPSIGWAAGIERLALLSEQEPMPAPQKTVIISVGEENITESIRIAEHLRLQEIPVEISPKYQPKSALKAANKTGARWAILIGSEEITKQSYILKDLLNGHQENGSIRTIITILKNQN